MSCLQLFILYINFDVHNGNVTPNTKCHQGSVVSVDSRQTNLWTQS